MTGGANGTAPRDLRALRYDPPGYAKQGARRRTFQSALEQCEQFQAAAHDAGYATRPVQLFYALSQAGRAIVAASPRMGNQAWRVSGHGLTANTNAASAADVTVTATKAGLFPAVAAALELEALVPDEPIALRELWPLLPESALVPLTTDAMLPVLLFSQQGWPDAAVFSEAEINWIPRHVKDLYGEDPARVKEHPGFPWNRGDFCNADLVSAAVLRCPIRAPERRACPGGGPAGWAARPAEEERPGRGQARAHCGGQEKRRHVRPPPRRSGRAHS